MLTSSTALERERLRLFLRVVAVSAVVGALYGLFVSRNAGPALASLAIGAANGALIAGGISGIEIFLLQGRRFGRRLAGLPFVAAFLLKALVYGAVVSAVVVGSARLMHALPGMGGNPIDVQSERIAVAFSMVMTLIFVIVLQAAGLLGRRTFRNLVLGRYRQPRAERRFFLFVDVMGSTAIAERLGPLQAHRFLAEVFSLTAEPVAACRGEIYQYVGDEIVVTWPEDEGRVDGRPLRCYFAMQAALDAAAAEFRGRFGAGPSLRGALHLGEVIAGEVGEQRRAIVYHGDVMNTAARLEQATRDAGVLFIASAAALESLGPQSGIEARDLGALALRGRAEPIRAYAVEALSAA